MKTIGLKWLLIIALWSAGCLAETGAVTPDAPAQTAAASSPLSAEVKKGVDWLLKHQMENGGWSQGEESPNMRGRGNNVTDASSVADTSIALMALLRTNNDLKSGPYSAAILRGIAFICSQIEEANDNDLYVTSVRGTRVQMKIGTYVDTFLAAMVLAEVKDKMPSDEDNQRVSRNLEKTVRKIEKNLRNDGTWHNEGWAPILSQNLGSRALNYASVKGIAVDENARLRVEKGAQDRVEAQTDVGSGPDGRKARASAVSSAGVELYSASANLNDLLQSSTANDYKRREIQDKLKTSKDEDEKKAMQEELNRYDNNDRILKSEQQRIIERMNDPKFISGFGSNGGEEFLSYMNIGEALFISDSSEWNNWSDKIYSNLNRIQNADGSWTGHHCITGRTFCTSAALLTLTIDRMEKPAAKIQVSAQKEDN